METSTFTLPCGLRIVHTTSPTPVAYCGFAIDCGTRDEAGQESGMAHYVEHLLFKGTTHRRAWHILNRMEQVGGDLNAFTNKEETVVYAAFLSEHFRRAAQLLVDIVFQSTFPQKEMEKEVEVIIDEIESYEDSPSELIYDDFENLVFPGHPLGRNILGRPDQLRSYRSEALQQFYHRYYQPQNAVFFLHGNIPFQKVVDTLARLMQDIPCRPDWQRPVRQPLTPYTPAQKTLHRDTHQAHVILGTRSYPAGDARRTPLFFLNNLLGGPGMNSRLNVSLRERRGLVYTVESNLSSYTDTGVFSIYFGCDAADVSRCLHLCRSELDRLQQTPLTPAQLQSARRQLKGQIGVSCDNFENTILDIAKTYLHYHLCETLQDIYHRLDALTPAQVQQTAQDLFAEAKMSLLRYE